VSVWGGRRFDPAIAFLAAVAVLMAVDLFEDRRTGVTLLHLGVEVAVMVAALGGALALWSRERAARRKLSAMDSDLRAARDALATFRSEAAAPLRELGDALDRQFRRWQLTPAESDVTLLLLKGFKHREIAELRNTAERTVRQQALSVYKKAGLAGRTELAAFFLEDLLLPETNAARTA
jgi:DNA-binding NarL/FixJ family response regulator